GKETAMAQNKTKATPDGITAFLAAIPHPVRQSDARALVPLFERVSGAPATMWGPSIIGFGRYQYRHDSGREGEMCRIGFSPRAAQTVFYLAAHHRHEDLLARLGKHKTGTGCLYVNKLADVDLTVLEALVSDAWAAMAE